MNAARLTGVSILLGILLWVLQHWFPFPVPAPKTPSNPAPVKPEPKPDDKPKRPLRPWKDVEEPKV